MSVLESRVDERASDFARNFAAMAALVEDLRAQLARALELAAADDEDDD